MMSLYKSDRAFSQHSLKKKCAFNSYKRELVVIIKC